jgi:hypothetical protein
MPRVALFAGDADKERGLEVRGAAIRLAQNDNFCPD